MEGRTGDQNPSAVVGETLGETDGVALVDESGVVKQGSNSVDVAAQYCGSVGKIANSQMGVYLGYASRNGYSLIEGQLFMPESWFDEEHSLQRTLCGVPQDLKPKTKPEIGLELLKRAIGRGGLPFQWVAADELCGDSSAFRDSVAGINKWYFTEIKGSSLIWQSHLKVYLPEWKGRGRHPTHWRLCNSADLPFRVDDLVALIQPDGWTPCKINEGSKGPIICEFAFLRIVEARANLPGPEVWLVIRRNLDDLSVLKFYFSNAPARTSLIEFVRISGMRWLIETIFEESKGEIGLDQYEMRSWLGWHHYMLLVALAHNFLVRLRVRFHEKSPIITVYQIRFFVVCRSTKAYFHSCFYFTTHLLLSETKLPGLFVSPQVETCPTCSFVTQPFAVILIRYNYNWAAQTTPVSVCISVNS